MSAPTSTSTRPPLGPVVLVTTWSCLVCHYLPPAEPDGPCPLCSYPIVRLTFHAPTTAAREAQEARANAG